MHRGQSRCTACLTPTSCCPQLLHALRLHTHRVKQALSGGNTLLAQNVWTEICVKDSQDLTLARCILQEDPGVFAGVMTQVGQGLVVASRGLLTPQASPLLTPGGSHEEIGERICATLAVFAQHAPIMAQSQQDLLEQVRASLMLVVPPLRLSDGTGITQPACCWLDPISQVCSPWLPALC